MKKYMFIMLGIFLISLVNAVPTQPLEVRTGSPNSAYMYVLNYSLASNCSNILLSYNDDIVTDLNGNYMFQIPLSSLGKIIPYYLCEYKNGALRKTHEFSDQIFNSIWVRNITVERIDTQYIYSDNWSNVTIKESQISDLDHFDNSDETDPLAYNGTLAFDSRVSDVNNTLQIYLTANQSNSSEYANCWMTSEGLKCDVSDITYDEISGGDVNALGYTGYFNYLAGAVGLLSMDGDPWYLGGTDLEIDQDLQVDNLNVENDILPTSSLVGEIGSGALRWLNLYVQNINAEEIDAYNLALSENLSVGGNVTIGGLINGVNVSNFDSMFATTPTKRFS